jgi:hypothetical protein
MRDRSGDGRARNSDKEPTVRIVVRPEEAVMSRVLFASKCALFVGAAMLLSVAAAPLHAQGFPEGSYLRSCTHVAVHGDRLLADCRRTDGSWERTALRDVDRCVGDIGNMNGELACNRAGGNYGSSRDRDYRRQWRGNGYGDGNRDYGPGWGTSSGYSRYRGDWPPAGYPSDYGR